MRERGRAFGAALAVAAQFPVMIGGGAAAGFWLDEKLGTFPWLFLAGLFGGLISSFRMFLWMRKRVFGQEQRGAED